MVKIIVGFEGSCPQSLEGVRQEGVNVFRIFPSWRPSPGVSEESIGRSTRLGFKVVNDRQISEPVELLIDWQYNDVPESTAPQFKDIQEFMSYRDFVVVKGPPDTQWRTIIADVDEDVTVVRLDVPPGETEIHWHPPYTYTQAEAFVASLHGHPWVQIEKAGQSEQGRNIWLIKITDHSRQPKKNAFIRARVHGYESAGSYALEGMVQWLLRGDPWAAQAVHRYVFYFIPMSNPDGVYNGLGRLTAPQGADLTWVFSVPDRIHDVMKHTVDRLKPVLFVDLHNWQNKHIDGLLWLDVWVRERFLRFMPDQTEFGKVWHIQDPPPIPAKAPVRETLGQYCRRLYGAVAVSFEFPWFGRTPHDVRETGRKALWALMRALDEPPAGVGWMPAMWKRT